MGWSKTLLVGVLMVVTISGCVRYSFKGALPPNIQTIAIAPFEDASRFQWGGLREEFNSMLVDAFIRDNTLKVVNTSQNADLYLTGKIVSIQEQKSAISPTEQVEQIQLYLTVDVKCVNQHTGKVFWKGTLRRNLPIEGAGTLEEKNTILIKLSEMIVEDIVNKIIAAW